MIEAIMYKVRFTFKDNTIKEFTMTENGIDTLYDKLYQRDPVMWLDIWNDIINLNDVRHIYYEEIEYDEL